MAPRRATIERLWYVGQYDRTGFAFDKDLIRLGISPQAIPSIIGATEKRRDSVSATLSVFSIT